MHSTSHKTATPTKPKPRKMNKRYKIDTLEKLVHSTRNMLTLQSRLTVLEKYGLDITIRRDRGGFIEGFSDWSAELIEHGTDISLGFGTGKDPFKALDSALKDCLSVANGATGEKRLLP